MPQRLLSLLQPPRRLCSVLLVSAGALLGGCRSEQAAFQFRPAAGNVPIAVASSSFPNDSELNTATGPAASQRVPEVAYVPAKTPPASARLNPNAPTVRNVTARLAARRPLVAVLRLRHKSAEVAGRRPGNTALRETGHLVLGIVLVAAGVVAGLLLGGWLGLGVGAAVVILGYYFLGLAFGGKHAWQEVFQEFFNM